MIFTDKELKEIRDAISIAEKETSGELRVHLEKSCRGNLLDRAAYIFKTLKMHETAERNGVLFYLAYKDRKFAILGDSGINNLVPPNFWDEIRDKMQDNFKNGQFIDGLTAGIVMAGNALKEFFPYHFNDVNELSNEVSVGEI